MLYFRVCERHNAGQLGRGMCMSDLCMHEVGMSLYLLDIAIGNQMSGESKWHHVCPLQQR